jgi:hypothetical protein
MPKLHAIFMAPAKARRHIIDLGFFMPTPVAIADLIIVVRGYLGSVQRSQAALVGLLSSAETAEPAVAPGSVLRSFRNH